ncbi:hypothetical protein ACSQ67_023762 [Phaseolus vulgaris]
MKIVKAKKDEITSNGRKGGIDLLVRLWEGGRASGHGGESYNYKYDNGGERHHISKHGEEEVLVDGENEGFVGEGLRRSPPRRVLHSRTTNFGNFPKGKPFTEILGNTPLSSSSCCLDSNKPLPPLSTMFNIGSEMSIARFS